MGEENKAEELIHSLLPGEDYGSPLWLLDPLGITVILARHPAAFRTEASWVRRSACALRSQAARQTAG
jgi:hypothetical protein